MTQCLSRQAIELMISTTTIATKQYFMSTLCQVYDLLNAPAPDLTLCHLSSMLTSPSSVNLQIHLTKTNLIALSQLVDVKSLRT